MADKQGARNKFNLKNYVYNKDQKTFLGRTKQQWAALALFYIIFYGILTMFIICNWFVFSKTVDPRIPKYRTTESIIGTNPGLGFRPLPDDVDSALIHLECGHNPKLYTKWADKLNSFLEGFINESKDALPCSYGNLPLQGDICMVDLSNWGNCSKDNYFGYKSKQPCIIIKLNKIYGWTPEYYNDSVDFPKSMPMDLQYHIGNLSEIEKNTIWVSCEGETPRDDKSMGPLVYHSEIRGFPGYYYPYLNIPDYRSPLMAVQFMQPEPDVTISVCCKAWAKNIKHDPMQTVTFQILID